MSGIEIIPIFLIFLFWIIGHRKNLETRGLGRVRRFLAWIITRLGVIVCGAVASWLINSLYASRFVQTSFISLLSGGLRWLILFEIVWQFRRHLRTRTLPIFIAAVLLLSIPVGVGLFFVLSWIEGTGISHFWQEYYSSPMHWLPRLIGFPATLYQLISPTALVFLTYRILSMRGGATKARTPSESARQTTWSTCKGGNMNPSKSQTTRLLSASAFLTRGFAEQLLTRLKSKGVAVSPEIGTDLELIARVCQFARARERRFQVILFGIALVAFACTFLDPIVGAVVLIAGGAMTYFRKLYSERKLVRDFARDRFENLDVNKRFPQLKAREWDALPNKDQNLFVYRDFTPFLGAGTNLGGWSFTVDLSKPAETLSGTGSPEIFQMEELYANLSAGIKETGLEDVNIKDAYFVRGNEIGNDREILPHAYSRPIQRLETEPAKALITRSNPHLRHYKWITVHDWGQELVTSYFIRCSKQGNNMFVEINRYVLTPIAEQYRGVDALTSMGARHVIGYLILAAIAGPLYAAVSPLLMLGRLQEAVKDLFDAEEKQRRKNIDDNPQYNFGTAQSFREVVSSGHFMHYFQKADGDFYLKVLERTLLDRIIAFLDAHQIDTSDLRERQMMILNSGIIVHGGDVNAESLAVGEGARASKRTQQVVTKAPSKGAAA